MPFPPFIAQHTLFWSTLAAWTPFIYIGIFLGMILEGEAVLFSTIVLSLNHILNPYIALPFAAVSLLFGDLLWYMVGIHVLPRFSWLYRVVHKLAKPFDSQLQKNPFRLIFISKFAYGIHHAVLMRAGQSGVKLRRYLEIIVVANIAWFGLIFAAAYFLSASLGLLRHYLRFAEFFILFGILAFVAVEHFVGIFSERALEHTSDDTTLS